MTLVQFNRGLIRNQNCQLLMDCPVREFCFGFYLCSLQLMDDVHLTLESFTHFRILLLNSGRTLAQSRPFLCLPNQHCEVVVNELLSFRAGEETECCELRLMVDSEEGQQRVIGRYEFPLNNYMRAYEELRRNCIELNVQIAPNYALVYDVFLERSEAALQRIIRQHQAAVRCRMHADAISEVDSFFPHEMYGSQEEGRDIRIDEASPLLFNQRFWSPKRGRFGGSRRLSILSPTTSAAEAESGSLLTDSNRISLLKLSKTASTFSDLQASKGRKVSGAASNIQELDIQSQPETQDNQEQLIQLYEVIKSDSKIVLPDQLEHQGQQKCHSQPLVEAGQKKLKRSLKKYHNPVKYIILAVIILTIAGFFLYLFDKPTLNFPKGKRDKKGKRPKRRV